MVNFKIRNYKDSDYLDVKYNLEEAGLFYPNSESKERLYEMSRRDPGSVIVADYEGIAVGNIFAIDAIGWSGFLHRLAVRKEYRENGISRMLWDAGEEFLKCKGLSAIYLIVEESKHHLAPSYEKRGYETIPDRFRLMYKSIECVTGKTIPILERDDYQLEKKPSE